MRVLDLFTGAGGSAWAGRLLGWTHVAYCEADPYCRRVLQARMDDGSFDVAPIHDDVKTLDASIYHGAVDVVCGGFPCQPWSTAGSMRGTDDPRDLWPDMLRIAVECGAARIFAENVQRAPIERAARECEALGLGTVYGHLSAGDLGAWHERRRWWLLAWRPADADGQQVRDEQQRVPGGWARGVCDEGQGVALDNGWRSSGPVMVRGVHGVAHRRDRVRALGNGWAPVVAAAAYRILERRAGLKSTHTTLDY